MTFHVKDYELVNSLGDSIPEIMTALAAGKRNAVPYKGRTQEVALIRGKNRFKRNGMSLVGSICSHVIEKVLSRSDIDLKRTALIMSTCCGNVSEYEKELDPSKNPQSVYSEIIRAFGMRDVGITVGNACAAGQVAIDVACRILATETEIDNVLVCSYDILSDFIFAGFNSVKALASAFCDPFGRSDGMSLGEAVGCMVVGRDSGRCVIVRSEINNDAYHMISPEPTAEAKKELLLRLKPLCEGRDVIISPHGTGTQKNDESEKAAIEEVFPNASIVPTKGLTGHCLGCSGFAECMFLIEKILKSDANTVGVSLSFAFGGTNSAVAFMADSVVLPSKASSRNAAVRSIRKMSLDDAKTKMPALGTSELKLRKCDTPGVLAVCAGLAGIGRPSDRYRVGSVVAVDADANDTIREFVANVRNNGIDAAKAFHFPNTVYNAPQGHMMMQTGMRGYNVTLIGGSLNDAVNICRSAVAEGTADAMLAVKVSKDSVEYATVKAEQ